LNKAQIDLSDLLRLDSRGFSKAESIGAGSVTKTDKPLEGVINRQHNRNAHARDILNIGSGTRCSNCGLLYFCWTENCSSCGAGMDFNLGHRDEGVRN
jgi:hypothetical protein